MNIIKIAILLPSLWLGCVTATPLGDIDVTLDVTAQPRIEIEKPQGGWYNSIKLHSSPDNRALFQAEVPIVVKLRRQEGYQLSVKKPLILARQSDAASATEQRFSPAKVRWGNDSANLRLLSDVPTSFHQPLNAASRTTRDYVLHISALAPIGEDIAGKYHGQLTLIFETNS